MKTNRRIPGELYGPDMKLLSDHRYLDWPQVVEVALQELRNDDDGKATAVGGRTERGT